VPGLGARLGRGGATNPQQSLAESDCIVIMGSNMAENHPVGFRFVKKAKERGTTIVHVDPRFSRTSAMVELHVPLRAGTDAAFLGGIINYLLNDERWLNDEFFQTHLHHYTNAEAIISEQFRDAADLGGIFSGFDPDSGMYEFDTWKSAGEHI
jgi:formate dehydrogenase major subunit